MCFKSKMMYVNFLDTEGTVYARMRMNQFYGNKDYKNWEWSYLIALSWWEPPGSELTFFHCVYSLSPSSRVLISSWISWNRGPSPFKTECCVVLASHAGTCTYCQCPMGVSSEEKVNSQHFFDLIVPFKPFRATLSKQVCFSLNSIYLNVCSWYFLKTSLSSVFVWE